MRLHCKTCGRTHPLRPMQNAGLHDLAEYECWAKPEAKR